MNPLERLAEQIREMKPSDLLTNKLAVLIEDAFDEAKGVTVPQSQYHPELYQEGDLEKFIGCDPDGIYPRDVENLEQEVVEAALAFNQTLKVSREEVKDVAVLTEGAQAVYRLCKAADELEQVRAKIGV